MSIGTIKPFVKLHKYDQNLVADIQALNSSGYKREDIYVLKWNPDKNHSNQRDNYYKYSKHFEDAIGDIDSKAQFFDNGGKELRSKLEHLGLNKDEAAALLRELEETDNTCILYVRELRDHIIEMK
ncbi:general stress protein [Brevibacillus humidisoli]|uniref:general stress protein n=1 Tax=Brevibacillus humidisoli TaxID=2895522 RepID=UPI001E46A1FE|nr:general stress protein [Brevibacillus humidisoli]UFJ42291.1 general stress protein [Brevibacillus humidisoli]